MFAAGEPWATRLLFCVTVQTIVDFSEAAADER